MQDALAQGQSALAEDVRTEVKTVDADNSESDEIESVESLAATVAALMGKAVDDSKHHTGAALDVLEGLENVAKEGGGEPRSRLAAPNQLGAEAFRGSESQSRQVVQPASSEDRSRQAHSDAMPNAGSADNGMVTQVSHSLRDGAQQHANMFLIPSCFPRVS